MKKRIMSLLIALSILGSFGAFASEPTPSTTPVQTSGGNLVTEGTVTIMAKVMATKIDVTVPLFEVQYSINPNADDEDLVFMYVPFQIINRSPSAIKVSVKSFYSETFANDGKFEDVLPDKDGRNKAAWKALSAADSKKEIALGIKPINNTVSGDDLEVVANDGNEQSPGLVYTESASEWSKITNGTINGAIWAANVKNADGLASTTTPLGVLAPGKTGIVGLEAFHGMAFESDATEIKHKLVLTFELDDGVDTGLGGTITASSLTDVEKAVQKINAYITNSANGVLGDVSSTNFNTKVAMINYLTDSSSGKLKDILADDATIYNGLGLSSPTTITVHCIDFRPATSTNDGQFKFALKVTDSTNVAVSREFTIVVKKPTP